MSALPTALHRARLNPSSSAMRRRAVSSSSSAASARSPFICQTSIFVIYCRSPSSSDPATRERDSFAANNNSYNLPFRAFNSPTFRSNISEKNFSSKYISLAFIFFFLFFRFEFRCEIYIFVPDIYSVKQIYSQLPQLYFRPRFFERRHL